MRIAVTAPLLRPLSGELGKIDREGAPFAAAEAAARLRSASAEPDRETGPLEPSRAQAWAILRAIEHLRQFSPPAADLLRLRDALQAELGLAASRVRYLVCDREGHEREEHFTSFSGPYAVGDRLVTTDGRAWRIRHLELTAPGVPERLFVERWTIVPAEPRSA